MEKPKAQEDDELVLIIMNKIDEYDVPEKWRNEVLSHYDRSTNTYTGIRNAEDFICEKCQELEAWLEALLDDVSGKFIDDVMKAYFGIMFIGAEYAYQLANDEVSPLGKETYEINKVSSRNYVKGGFAYEIQINVQNGDRN